MSATLASVDIEFGTLVRVCATVQPVYIQAHTERIEHKPSTVNGWRRLETIHEDGPLKHRPADKWAWSPDECHDDGIPGLPLPNAAPLPERKGTYRVLRRFPYPDGVPGVVVGKTWRAEGQYHEGGGGMSYFGEYDYDPPYLAESRRVVVLQVALDPGDIGGRAWAADIALALPDNVERAT